MKVSITVVATKTLTAGFVPSGDVAMLPMNGGNCDHDEPIEDSTAMVQSFAGSHFVVPWLNISTTKDTRPHDRRAKKCTPS
jgi:hypothetical protein